MAADSKKLQPIIIKRIKKGGHGAHGGAWKIAYADFVTAMMAFFLLMWLLGSTTDGDKKGIADYFTSPMRMSLLGGSGSGDSTSIIKGGGTDLSRQTGQVKQGEIAAQRRSVNLRALQAEQLRAEKAKLEELKAKVEELIKASAKLSGAKSQVRLDMTRDGLRIQIVDELSRPMFDSGSAVVRPQMREILREIGSVLAEVPNRLTLEGHTDSTPFPGGERGYSNWELSSDRANASRREMIAGGLPENRVLRVLGLAASLLLEPDKPDAPANRRISITVMNREAEDRAFRTTPDSTGEDGSRDADTPSATKLVGIALPGAGMPQPPTAAALPSIPTLSGR
jgi:chemotaxis protein MotB